MDICMYIHLVQSDLIVGVYTYTLAVLPGLLSALLHLQMEF